MAHWTTSVRYALLILLIGTASAAAEPYLAVRSGLACHACHASPVGGGLRTPFGNAYAQSTLPARPSTNDGLWTGTFAKRFGAGADARWSARQFENDDRDDNLEFETDRVTLYGLVTPVDHVTLYLDQQVAPGSSSNREAWFKLDHKSFYLRGGKLFLPYGWRLEDDTALVREATGINFATPDEGVEFGYLSDHLTAQLAITNGNGGGPEMDDDKQGTLRIAYLRGPAQFGVSGSYNDTDSGERAMGGVFAGLRTGPVAWLAEWDRISDDDVPGGADADQHVALFEANVAFLPGHNLKLTAEGQWFDDDEEDRFRYSAVWEYTPLAFTQFRLGVRARDSDDPRASLNNEEYFLQAHLFF